MKAVIKMMTMAAKLVMKNGTVTMLRVKVRFLGASHL